MTESTRNIELVFGASGYIGANLTDFLLAEGRRVRATARNAEVLRDRGWQSADLRAADALEPASLEDVLADVDTAYYLVHSMAAGKDFPSLDAEAARNFAKAAASQGVRRIVYLGGLVPDRPVSTHLRSRQETGDILRAGSVPVTELRAGMIIGPGSAAWEVIRDLVNHLPLMVTPRWVFSRSTPIALSNLLRYLADVGRIEETAGQVYEVGGPDTLSYEEVMRRYGRLVGKNPVILPVPILSPRLSSYWLRLVTSVPTNVARALIDGLTQDVIATDERLQSLIPQQLLGFDEAATRALEAERLHAVPARWVDSAIACKNFRPEYGYYSKQTGASAVTDLPAEALWAEICKFGASGDYFWGRLLWWLRRFVDWLVGGPSFRRKRRHPTELRVGDVIDSWRVIGIEPGRQLLLLLEMKVMGAGVLRFTVSDRGNDREVSMRAYFHPAGFWGLLYWYALLPLHSILFRRSTQNVVARAARTTEPPREARA